MVTNHFYLDPSTADAREHTMLQELTEAREQETPDTIFVRLHVADLDVQTGDKTLMRLYHILRMNSQRLGIHIFVEPDVRGTACIVSFPFTRTNISCITDALHMYRFRYETYPPRRKAEIDFDSQL